MKTIFLIGREPDCDIILWNNEISRHHAQIRIDQKGKLWLMDTSTNGTYLNGIRIASNVEMEVTRKDEITFACVDRLDWNQIPKKKNKQLWIILSISILVLIALVVALCLLLIPSKTTNSEDVVIAPLTESVDTLQTTEIEMDSIVRVEVNVPVKEKVETPKATSTKQTKENESNKIAKEIYKNLNRKKERSSSANDNKQAEKSTSTSKQTTPVDEEVTAKEDNVVDAIF